jgi:hypothetical protein
VTAARRARQQREKEEQARSAHEADQQKAMWEKLRREAAEARASML